MGVMASMIAFLFMNIFDNLFFVPKATTYFWFLLATAEALLNQRNVF
ncbi:MAG: putative inorganic carbon (HCO3(-)) transporter [Clostridium sp.]|jgi:putative inorganic carbon (HCO3(-)) transporter